MVLARVEERSLGKDWVRMSVAMPLATTESGIASLSLGATLKFQLRPRTGGKSVDYWLEHGSLLLMQPGCQEDWVHQIPKTSKSVGEKINLTFRPHTNGS